MPSTVRVAAVLSLFTALAGYYAIAVGDSDFWWHLAAGEQIVAAREIPSGDPFGVYDTAGYWTDTVLKSQWLGQVVLYGAHRTLGLDGVILLRMTILLVSLGVVFWRGRLAGAPRPALSLVILLAGLTLRGHTGERPQLFSFLFFTVLVAIVEWALASGRRSVLATVPVLFALWANTHGGAVLGVAALAAFVVFLVTERTLLGNAAAIRSAAPLGIAAIAGFAGTLVTPNGLTTYEYIVRLEQHPLRGRLSEYVSPLTLATDLAGVPHLPWFWLFLALALWACVSSISRRQMKEPAMIVLLAVVSLTAYRYIPFFVLYAAPVVALGLGRAAARARPLARPVHAVILVTGLVLLAFGTSTRTMFTRGLAAGHFPVAMTEYARSHAVSGRMFNYLGWGGYLLWNLHPGVTIFIDGRLLDPMRAAPYTHVLWTTDDGVRYFDHERFDLVAIPHRNPLSPRSERYPLIAYLSRRPDWTLVYHDPSGVLFARATAGVR